MRGRCYVTANERAGRQEDYTPPGIFCNEAYAISMACRTTSRFVRNAQTDDGIADDGTNETCCVDHDL